MDTVFDYIKWMGEFSFDVKSFCEPDAMVLSLLSYYDFSRRNDSGRPLTLRATCSRIRKERSAPPPFSARTTIPVDEFLELAAQSARFGELLVRDYTETLDHERSVQFAAVTFEHDGGFRFISFRGTDDTLAGWKEDFMISFTRTEAQELALDYTRDHLDPQLTNYIGGHSKGANLALYSAAHLRYDEFDHVGQVYILDGPGFCDEVLDTAMIANVSRRATRIIPRYSVIGELFAPKIEHTVIVDSCEKSFMQHDVFTWGIDHGRLLTADSLDPQAIRMNDFVGGWIEDVSREERRVFVSELFDALAADGARTIADVIKLGPGGLENIVIRLIGSSKATRKTVASLPAQAALGSTVHHIRSMGILKWLDECEVAKCMILIAIGVFFLIASEKALDITAMIFFIALALAELGFTLFRLYHAKWDFSTAKERLYLLVILVAICIVVLIKENALFMLGSILYGILAIVMSFRQISKAINLKDDYAMRVIHVLEAVLLLVYGVGSLVAPYDAIYGFAVSIGILLIADGVIRLIYHIYLLCRLNDHGHSR